MCKFSSFRMPLPARTCLQTCLQLQYPPASDRMKTACSCKSKDEAACFSITASLCTSHDYTLEYPVWCVQHTICCQTFDLDYYFVQKFLVLSNPFLP